MYGVYLVDDESLILKSMVEKIPWKENGFEVVGRSISPLHALDEIKSIQPHLIFCDLKMPAMDGISFVQACRKGAIDAEFVMLSAFGEFEASRSFFQLGGFDYLLKPLQLQDAELVLERVSRKLAQRFDLQPVTAVSSTGVSAFDALIGHITEHYAQKHSLSALGEQFNLSEKYICNLFSKYYHSTLTMYLTNIRTKEAARLIATTEKSLKEIALSCGYSDYFYFCRVFKNQMGASPSEFRQRSVEQ